MKYTILLVHNNAQFDLLSNLVYTENQRSVGKQVN